MKLSEAMLSQLHYHPPVGEVLSLPMCLMSGRSTDMWRYPQQLQHCQLAVAGAGQTCHSYHIWSLSPGAGISMSDVWSFLAGK